MLHFPSLDFDHDQDIVALRAAVGQACDHAKTPQAVRMLRKAAASWSFVARRQAL